MSSRVDVLGLHVSAIDPAGAVEEIGRWVDGRSREYVCVTGVHGVMESRRDPELLRIHNRAGMVTPDGMPLVWCSRYAGARWVQRVYGPDLILAVCAESVARGWRHYFYGAAPGVAELLASKLASRYPGLNVAGTWSPPYRDLTPDEVDEVVAHIEASQADIVWVGLSTPKQERWMSQFRPLLGSPVLIGVGAAFDIHAGMVRQAPVWMQQSGLEWAFRLAVEPRRLWRRYLTANPAFLMQIASRRPRLIVDHPTEEGSPDDWQGA